MAPKRKVGLVTKMNTKPDEVICVSALLFAHAETEPDTVSVPPSLRLAIALSGVWTRQVPRYVYEKQCGKFSRIFCLMIP